MFARFRRYPSVVVAATVLPALVAAPVVAAEPGSPVHAPAGFAAGWVNPRSSNWYDVLLFGTGKVAGRPGNVHAIRVSWDEGIMVDITDYACPTGIVGPAGCAKSGSETLYSSPGAATMTRVGRVGVDIAGTVSGDSGATYPVRLSLRPLGRIGYTIHSPYGERLMQRWDALRGTAAGRVGPWGLSQEGVTATAVSLTGATSYEWTGPGAPRPSAERDWVSTSDDRQGSVSWLRLGTVLGRPGNAHSGWVDTQVAWDAAADPWARVDAAEWNDWSCPAGVQPPKFATPNHVCTLLRNDQTWYAETGGGRTGREGLRVVGSVPVRVLTASGIRNTSTAVDVTLWPGGEHLRAPVWFGSGCKVVDTYANDAASTGPLGWVGLDSPRAEVTGGMLFVEKSFCTTG